MHVPSSWLLSFFLFFLFEANLLHVRIILRIHGMTGNKSTTQRCTIVLNRFLINANHILWQENLVYNIKSNAKVLLWRSIKHKLLLACNPHEFCVISFQCVWCVCFCSISLDTLYEKCHNLIALIGEHSTRCASKNFFFSSSQPLKIECSMHVSSSFFIYFTKCTIWIETLKWNIWFD